MEKYTFVLSYAAGPRMIKRIRLMREKFEVSVIFWKRSEENIWKFEETGIDQVEIYEPANYGKPLRRIKATIRFFRKANKYLNATQPKYVHVENLDMLLAASFYKRKCKDVIHLIYEVADIHELLLNDYRNPIMRIFQKALRHLEKNLCQGVDYLIVTSERFYDFYYKNLFDPAKYIFMPNMPNVRAFENYKPKKDGMFTVAFIGWIRYKQQLKILIQVSNQLGIDVLIAGSGADDEIKNFSSKFKNVTYYGKYDYDTEIAGLYNKADCIYAVYDRGKKNVDLALPNKLYESVYCELPLIVSKGTYLSETVLNWGVGYAIDCNDSKELANVLAKMKDKGEEYHKIQENCREMKRKIDIKNYNDSLLCKLEKL